MSQDQNPRYLHGHKVNPANDKLDVIVLDEPGAGGACHHYLIAGFALPIDDDTDSGMIMESAFLPFQDGPINEVGVNGITHEALLSILIDRLESFQAGDFACEENANALNNLQAAQAWLQKRTKDRMARNVEGTHEV